MDSSRRTQDLSDWQVPVLIQKVQLLPRILVSPQLHPQIFKCQCSFHIKQQHLHSLGRGKIGFILCIAYPFISLDQLKRLSIIIYDATSTKFPTVCYIQIFGDKHSTCKMVRCTGNQKSGLLKHVCSHELCRAKQWRDGDWMCTNCNNHNFASRSQCNRLVIDFLQIQLYLGLYLKEKLFMSFKTLGAWIF